MQQHRLLLTQVDLATITVSWVTRSAGTGRVSILSGVAGPDHHKEVWLASI